MAAFDMFRNTAAALGLIGLLGGCAGVAIEGANIAKDKAEASANMKDAEAGIQNVSGIHNALMGSEPIRPDTG